VEFRTKKESERNHLVSENVKNLVPSGPKIENRGTHSTVFTILLSETGVLMKHCSSLTYSSWGSQQGTGKWTKPRGKVCICV